MATPELPANPEPEQPLDQATSVGVDRDGNLKKIVTTPDGATRVEDFPSLSEARDTVLDGQQFHQIVDPPDPDFDHEAFQREHEAGDHLDLDALRRNIREQREGEQ